MSENVSDSEVRLVCCTNLKASIEFAKFSPGLPTVIDETHWSTCVITTLERLKLAQAPSNYSASEACSYHWTTRFWRPTGEPNTAFKPTQVCLATIACLCKGLRRPVIWVYGEFSNTDARLLVNQGLLAPEAVRSVSSLRSIELPSGARVSQSVHFPLILRIVSIDDLLLPFEQGFGHWAGVRVAIFETGSEPIDIYDRWQHRVCVNSSTDWEEFALPGGDRWSEHTLFTSDSVAPPNARAWMSPFGCEIREFALIAKDGIEAQSLASEIAKTVKLPLVVSRCNINDFRDWEINGTPPSDV